MIQSQDRSGWFGASDTAYIMGNWKTKTFQNWWLQKLGLDNRHFSTVATNAGTYFEHGVLDSIIAYRKDHQIIIPELLLRVNLDGDAPGQIFEIKTHKAEKEFKVSKAYYQQVQVQCFAKLMEEGEVPSAEIVSYALTEDDYKDFFRPIDPERIKRHPVAYDMAFIDSYLPRLKYLGECLRKGVFPE